MQPKPPPPSALGKYRLLSPTAVVRVLLFCLGAMSIGDAWLHMGIQFEENLFKVLDSFYETGGNSIVTANSYQNSIKQEHHTCLIPELMQTLDHLVEAAKVVYLGISHTSASVVAKANQYARGYGLRQFSVYQELYNATKRDAERAILPMLRGERMAFAFWAALDGGNF